MATDDKEVIMRTALECQRAGRLDEAETIYRRVLEIEPDEPDALHLLGMVHHARGDSLAAAELIGKAISVNKEVADYHGNLAAVALALQNPSAAIGHANTAISLDPAFGDAHYNLGNALFALGETEKAVQCFSDAIRTDESNDSYWANFLFALNFAPGAAREVVFKANRRWGEALELAVGRQDRTFGNDRSPDRKLRLAYYLPELEGHVTPRFLAPMLPCHDRTQFHIQVYGYRRDGGPAPRNLFDHVDGWTDVAHLAPADLARLMTHDGVDILIHPCTFKARYRSLLAFPAAPLQIAAINLVSSTGLTGATHLITDHYLDPPGETESFYTEEPVRLSGFNVYRQPEDAPQVDMLPTVTNGYVTFGSLNNPIKLTPVTIALWAEILGRVPGSCLFLKHRAFDSADVRDRFSAQFQDRGIATNRLVFEGYTRGAVDYLAAYNKIDIGLDPLPFGGGTTSYEAIWMGVPIVTTWGDNLMGRLTAQQMSRLGHIEFVADSAEDYADRAVAVAGNIPALVEVRVSLRQKAAETIFNADAYMREFEAALRDLWAGYCAG